MNSGQALDEQREELKERWKILRAEMENVNYDWAENGLAMWVEAKKIQFSLIFEQPVTREINKRLDDLLTEAHGTMFFDAIALGGKKDTKDLK